MKLTPEQEAIIQDVVNSHGLKLRSLQDDLVDHLCCVVENGLGKEKPFEQLLHEAIADLAPDGLNTIEQKTLFLLTSKRIVMMKKITYTIGFISSATLTAGVTFKLLHLPGGNELFISGFLAIFLVFVPLLAIDRYKVAISKAISDKLKFILGAVAAIITGLSGLFKLMHLQGADVLLMLGAFIFAVGFLPFLFFTMYRKSVS